MHFAYKTEDDTNSLKWPPPKCKYSTTQSICLLHKNIVQTKRFHFNVYLMFEHELYYQEVQEIKKHQSCIHCIAFKRNVLKKVITQVFGMKRALNSIKLNSFK